PAQLALTAKSDRGYELTEEKDEQAIHAEAVNLAPGTTTAQAFQVIARSAVRQFIANVPLVDLRNPEALHQMRIAHRRLSTWHSLLRGLGPDGQLESINAELKWLNRELSPARDHDTLADEVIDPLRKQHPDHHGLKSLSFTFSRQRVRGYRRAFKALAS